MAFDRILSILFYLSIATVTCVMAYRVQGYQADEPVWVHGRRTEKNFQNRLLFTGIFCILFSVAALRFDLGNPVEFLLSAGNDHDSTHAVELLKKVDITGSNILNLTRRKKSSVKIRQKGKRILRMWIR